MANRVAGTGPGPVSVPVAEHPAGHGALRKTRFNVVICAYLCAFLWRGSEKQGGVGAVIVSP